MGLLLPFAIACSGCENVPGREARAAPPSAPARLVSKAEALRGAGGAESALAGYRAAIQEDRAAVRPHLNYVRAMLSLGRRAALHREYEQRVGAGQATDAERTIAERLRTNGASSALRRVYAAASDRNPQSPWWQLALAEVEIAEADAWNRRRLDAIERGDRKEERQAFGQSRGAVGRAQRAVERAGRLAPDLAEVHLYRGLLRAVEGDLHPGGLAREAAYRGAAESFTQVTRLDPTLVEGWRGLGDVQFRLDELRGSLIAYLRAVSLAPADGTLRVSLGVVLHQVGRLREAAQQYREAARLRNWDAGPLIRLGDALADAENWDKALAAYRRALKRDPRALEAHVKMGALLEYRHRPREARAAYERYVAQGGERSGTVERRIERLLRAERR